MNDGSMIFVIIAFWPRDSRVVAAKSQRNLILVAVWQMKHTSQVDMYRTDALSLVLPASQHSLRVHSLSVLASKTGTDILWIVPSRMVTITGSGPKSLVIMQTLARATRRATPATGQVNGTEYSGGPQQVTVSGPVTVPCLPVRQCIHGQPEDA
jgi:hypothetical protein